MCITGLKKTAQISNPNYHILEVDELYWFVGRKGTSETRENCYVIPIVSRLPRQIVGIDAAFDKSSERIQALVDAAPPAENYCTDGYWGYVDIAYPGKHIRNIRNKSDTFTVESVNADLRHYIPILRRRSRCFPRKLETLRAVLDVFAKAVEALKKGWEVSMQRNAYIAQSYANSSVLLNLPLSRLERRPKDYEAVTPTDIQKMCADLLPRGPARVVLYPER